jgi:hypothetical protein
MSAERSLDVLEAACVWNENEKVRRERAALMHATLARFSTPLKHAISGACFIRFRPGFRPPGSIMTEQFGGQRR